MQALVSEADDLAHYYFAPYVLSTSDPDRPPGYVPLLFGGGGFNADTVDLRHPSTPTAGYAFVRCALSPAQLVTATGAALPPAVVHVGQSLVAPLPTAARSQARTLLGIRGQVATVKDVLRFMLLVESGEAGKPNRLAPEPDGGLYVYLGDLRVDLSV